jgi:hypothetical protein
VRLSRNRFGSLSLDSPFHKDNSLSQFASVSAKKWAVVRKAQNFGFAELSTPDSIQR